MRIYLFRAVRKGVHPWQLYSSPVPDQGTVPLHLVIGPGAHREQRAPPAGKDRHHRWRSPRPRRRQPVCTGARRLPNAQAELSDCQGAARDSAAVAAPTQSTRGPGGRPSWLDTRIRAAEVLLRFPHALAKCLSVGILGLILAVALRRGDQSAALGATKTDQCTETKGRRNRLAAAMSAGNRAADEESQKPEQNTPSAHSGQGAEGQERGPEARWKALS